MGRRAATLVSAAWLILASCSAASQTDVRDGAVTAEAARESRGSSGREEIVRVLDALHRAASAADEAAYFELFAPDAVFLGTDPGERWSVARFRDYVHPYFSEGRGWTYTPRDRSVQLSADGSVGWFDETLDNAKYGECRGTGVLQRIDGVWKIAQYSLSLPIPNDLTPAVVDLIRESQNGP